MSVKMSGAEWKVFFNDDSAWKDYSWYISGMTVNGDCSDDLDMTEVADDARVVVDGGIFSLEDDPDASSRGFEAVINKWRKAQTMTHLVVEVSKDQAETIKVLIKAAGGKVL